MKTTCLLLASLLSLCVTASSNTTRKKGVSEREDDSFDLLIFAQNWPVADCVEWKDRSSKNTCRMPPKLRWTVHGIWPTRFHEREPVNCDGKPFNPKALDSIMDDLQEHWTNVHKNSDQDGFWKHEWEKHGTCASQLEPFSTEIKYFKYGIGLNKKFPIYEYLDNAGIIAGLDYDFDKLFNVVKNAIGGHNPALECEYNRDEHKTMITQINVCLDKSLNVTDCDKTSGGLNHGCPARGSLIYYPPFKGDMTPANNTTMAVIVCLLTVAAIVFLMFYYVRKRYGYSVLEHIRSNVTSYENL